MADDKKIIIEGKFTEQKPGVNQPASAPGATSGVTREGRGGLASAVATAAGSLAGNALSQAIRPTIESALAAIRSGESPISGLGAQFPEVVGAVETPVPTPAATTPSSPGIGRWGSGATTAKGVGGEGGFTPWAGLPPIPPTLQPGGPGPAMAAAGAAYGGGGGGVAVANPAAAAASAALASQIGVIALGFVGLASATTGLTGLFLSAFDAISHQMEEFNANAQLARAQQDLELTIQKIKSGEKAAGGGDFWDRTSALISEETDFYKNMIALSEKAINILGPGLELLAEVTNDILDILNAVLEVVKYLSILINGIFKLITTILGTIRRFFERLLGVDNGDDEFQKDIQELFNTTTQVEHGRNTLLESRRYRPRPEANRPDIR